MNEKLKKVEFDCDQEEALESMLDGENVFLHGSGGCGKSLVIEEFVMRSKKRIRCLAFTANSSKNIHGRTIHSWLGLPITPIHRENISPLHESQQEVIRATDIIIFDECSTIRADLWEAASTQICNCYTGEQSKIPFAGKQIILSGDFLQLPPIVENRKTAVFLYDNFSGPYIFQTPLFKRMSFQHIHLRQVHRQDNPDFVKALEGIRTGNLFEPYKKQFTTHFLSRKEPLFIENQINHLDTINQLVRAPDLNDEDLVCLCPTKRLVAYINNIFYMNLIGKKHQSQGKKRGTFPQSQYPVPMNLQLKINMQVLIVANKYFSSGEIDYSNGDLGTLIGYTDKYKTIATVLLRNGRTVHVEPYTWDYYDYHLLRQEGKSRLETEPIGTYQQLPILPSYAMTIHKAQGKSLNSVHLVMGNVGFREYSQAYVALSRCRYMHSLSIEKPLIPLNIKVNQHALAFEQSQHLQMNEDIHDMHWG